MNRFRDIFNVTLPIVAQSSWNSFPSKPSTRRSLTRDTNTISLGSFDLVFSSKLSSTKIFNTGYTTATSEKIGNLQTSQDAKFQEVASNFMTIRTDTGALKNDTTAFTIEMTKIKTIQGDQTTNNRCNDRVSQIPGRSVDKDARSNGGHSETANGYSCKDQCHSF
jgi:hypothetical protein